MSDTRIRSSEALRQAICCGCGAARYAKARYLGRGTRRLRCAACRQVTTHAAVCWDGPDALEDANRVRDEAIVEALEQYDALVALFRSCQIDLLGIDDAGQGPGTQPDGGLVDIIRWLDPEGYVIRLRRGLTLADRLYCLDWAWKILRPSVARWNRYPVGLDADGRRFQHFYNDELEIGIYTLCS